MQLYHLGSEAYIYPALLAFIAVFIFIFMCFFVVIVVLKPEIHYITFHWRIYRYVGAIVTVCWSFWVAMSWGVSSIFNPEKRVLLSRCPTLLWGFNGLVGKGHRHPRPGKCRGTKNREEPKSRKVLKVAASSLMMCFFIFFVAALGSRSGAILIAPGGSVRLFQARDPQKLVHDFEKMKVGRRGKGGSNAKWLGEAKVIQIQLSGYICTCPLILFEAGSGWNRKKAPPLHELWFWLTPYTPNTKSLSVEARHMKTWYGWIETALVTGTLWTIYCGLDVLPTKLLHWIPLAHCRIVEPGC